MNKLYLQTITRVMPLAVLILIWVAALTSATNAQTADTPFKIGERLTYTVGFEKFTNVAYAEIHTVSRGKIGDVDAVELRSKIKTLEFVSAAFYLIDESRTIFASPESGVPVYISRTQNIGGLPKETIQNYLAAPTPNYDLVTMIYKIRHSGGSGTLNIQEGEKVYSVTFQTVANEKSKTGGDKIKTDAGEFETTLVAVQSDYLTENGLKDLKINFSTDEARLPVAIRFKTSKGEFHAKLASVQNVEPQAEATPTPTPVKSPTPLPLPTPTPRSYVDNQPLGTDLSFELGETLEYKLSSGSLPVATFVLQARERKQVDGVDSLLLTATVTEALAGNGLVNLNDGFKAHVNPESLGPRRLEINFSGSLSSLNQTVTFDERSSLITFKGGIPIEGPVGTHSLLSLVYAIRSFNLKPSKDTSNPVNDTRVAVFWEAKPYVFTLRPSSADIITLQGEKVSAQLISISTGNPQLDRLNLKIWLSNDARRVPLRFSAGSFQADLVSDKIVPPK
ncbi:MAG: DUF3108 domain-containing protein [Pyrinomonadaceae bacterium]